MGKDLLFYSNYCEYSKDIVTYITKKNMRSFFLFVCIDNNKYKIPEIIDRVPCILNHSKDTLYTDDQIVLYVDSKSQHANVVVDKDLQTFAWEKNDYSEGYSYLDTEEGGNISNKGYTYIEDHQSSSARKFQDDEDVLKQSKFDASIYDTYVASRNKDEEHIKKILHTNTLDRII